MTFNRHKKVGKYRGHTTHGGGHRKKRRGAGSRGGRGNAGTGKRAGHKVAGIKVDLGKHGFRRKRTISFGKSINVGRFTAVFVERLVKAGKVVQEKDIFVMDLDKLGYDKLLGTGSVGLKLNIMVKRYSARAAEKVKAAGGEIIEDKVEKTGEEKSKKEKTEDKEDGGKQEAK